MVGTGNAAEHSLAWDDPDVGIEWPLGGIDLQLSAKDAKGTRLSDLEAFT